MDLLNRCILFEAFSKRSYQSKEFCLCSCGGLGRWDKIGIPNNFDKLELVKKNMNKTRSIKGKFTYREIPDYRNEYKVALDWLCISIANNCLGTVGVVG